MQDDVYARALERIDKISADHKGTNVCPCWIVFGDRSNTLLRALLVERHWRNNLHVPGNYPEIRGAADAALREFVEGK